MNAQVISSIELELRQCLQNKEDALSFLAQQHAYLRNKALAYNFPKAAPRPRNVCSYCDKTLTKTTRNTCIFCRRIFCDTCMAGFGGHLGPCVNRANEAQLVFAEHLVETETLRNVCIFPRSVSTTSECNTASSCYGCTEKGSNNPSDSENIIIANSSVSGDNNFSHILPVLKVHMGTYVSNQIATHWIGSPHFFVTSVEAPSFSLCLEGKIQQHPDLATCAALIATCVSNQKLMLAYLVNNGISMGGTGNSQFKMHDTDCNILARTASAASGTIDQTHTTTTIAKSQVPSNAKKFNTRTRMETNITNQSTKWSEIDASGNLVQ